MGNEKHFQNLKAETYGRLIALGMIAITILSVANCKRTKSSDTHDTAEKKTSVVPGRKDVKAIMLNANTYNR